MLPYIGARVHKDYWVAIAIYVVAVVLTALPFFGIVTVKLDLDYGTLKFLHLVFVFLAIAILLGQLIAYNVMQHAKITTLEALKYLSLLDHGVPVCLVIIGVLGYSMAASYGPIWQTPWVYESAFGLFVYTLFGLITTLIFRRTRMNLDESTQSSVGVYAASGIGVVFLLFMSWVMVVKVPPVRTAVYFTSVTKYFSGAR